MMPRARSFAILRRLPLSSGNSDGFVLRNWVAAPAVQLLIANPFFSGKLSPRMAKKTEQLAGNAWMVITAAFFLVLGAGYWFVSREQVSGPAENSREFVGLEAEKQVYARYAGSASCRECHRKFYDDWSRSNHGLAERSLDSVIDDTAFREQPPFAHGGIETQPRIVDERLSLFTLGFDDEEQAYDVSRVIGHEPLRQFLVPHSNGRWQVVDAAYDPERSDWFSVHGDEDRRPGEWGHWTGRGMNWNSMCAACHNTRLRKNYDPATDTYRTTMAEMSVGCETCHGPMKDHVVWRKESPASPAVDPAVGKIPPGRRLDICGSCHSRRAELTGDFFPGESYFDHYNLTVPDESDLFFPDGQVYGENYVLTSFMSSRMHAAGVTCLDCHEPHTNRTLLPGNELCLTCHNGSRPDSPTIRPTDHSHHAEGSAGNLCVSCHMPQTTYMQRHPRRDHGFTIPDPLLTQRLGIPNACNRCHTDRSVQWAIDAVDRNYGERMERYTRKRTEWIAAARQGDDSAKQPLLDLLAGQDVPLWKASSARLLAAWLGENEVRTALISALGHTNDLVRAHAAIAVSPLVDNRHPETLGAVTELLADPVRNVRINAAWALRQQLEMDSLAGQELLHYLDHNADQPTGQMQLGAFALSRQQWQEALNHYGKAAQWDPGSPPIRHELAIVHSRMGNHRQALEELQTACRLAPEEAEYRYKLALAWNELRNVEQTIVELEAAVRLEPRHARAWYNLGLARNQQSDFEGAVDALIRGESAAPDDPDIPYARATILLRLGRHFEARQAAGRALTIRSDYEPARQLLEALPPQ